MRISKHTFQKRAEKLKHPNAFGFRVIVVRGFWGRLFKSKEFATLKETKEHYMRSALYNKR